MAKGALYCLKPLAWSSYLPFYRQSILRSGLVEEVQVLEYYENIKNTLHIIACIKMYFKIMLYNNLFLQAPKELREFIADHKFGQRNHSNGDPQEVDFTHQVGCP